MLPDTVDDICDAREVHAFELLNQWPDTCIFIKHGISTTRDNFFIIIWSITVLKFCTYLTKMQINDGYLCSSCLKPKLITVLKEKN